MPFRDCSFDIVLDKGTFDALVCDKERQMVQLLTQEMMRVTRRGGATVVITNGTEEKRVHLFEEFLQGYQFEIEIYKLDLNNLAMLINIMRNKTKENPISHAMKDKNILLESLMEMAEAQNERIKEAAEPQSKLLSLLMRAKAKREKEAVKQIIEKNN